MRVGEKGQVTIPKGVRDALGLGAGSRVAFELGEDDTVILRKVRNGHGRGRAVADRLRGRGDVAMTTDEIMELTRGD
jgi:AbrB family looped-hinge helix DNA binding protein